MAEINADNAVKILNNLQKTNGNYLNSDNGIKKEFKKDADASIFSQKNLYKKLGITNDEQYKDLIKGYDNGDGVLDANEAEKLAKAFKNGDVKGDKSLLSKVLSFVVGAVTAQCASMTDLRKIDSDNSILSSDTRSNLKGDPNKIIELGEEAINSGAWDGTNDNYDYLQYSGNDSASISSAINEALKDGKITQNEINNNNVLSKLLKERDLSSNGSYSDTSNSNNSSFYSMDSDGDGNISQEEMQNFINSMNENIKKALGFNTSNNSNTVNVDEPTSSLNASNTENTSSTDKSDTDNSSISNSSKYDLMSFVTTTNSYDLSNQGVKLTNTNGSYNWF